MAMPVEDDGPAAARAGVYCHHVLGHQGPLRASGLIMVSILSPRRYLSSCWATMNAPFVVVSCVAPPMCGMTIVFSRLDERIYGSGRVVADHVHTCAGQPAALQRPEQG